MIKAAFFDLDGTLVSFKTHSIPESTLRALDLLRRNGVKLFMASGRHRSMMYQLGDLQFDGYVTINGCITYVDGKIIDKHPIPHDVVLKKLDYMDKYPMPSCFVCEDGLVMNYLNEDTDAIFDLLAFPTPPLQDLREAVKTRDVYQFISFCPKSQDDDMMEQLGGCDSQRWHELFTDVVPKGISKVMGIQAIEKLMGITRDEIAAFGDGGNDIDMLEYVGLGIAMGNASPDVQKRANVVTTSVDDDGILNAVNKWILK
ncbi:MAG: Cof-type HAD-IIB family hydrolase [Bacteroidia bacterium]|nr:Cof-type HAD-IIB family hydrolase [Bacteroidia bacterium]